jgi:mRNA interferase MazF
MIIQPGEFWVPDIPFTDGSASKKRPILVRLSRLDCLEQSLLLFRLGRISPVDARNLKNVWTRHIKPQF